MLTRRKPKTVTIVTASLLLIISFLIKLASYYPEWVEHNYSRGVYPYISFFYRSLFGWVPFSVGDIVYFLAGVYLLSLVVRGVRVIRAKKWRQVDYYKRVKRFFYVTAIIYVYFNLSWGLNYNRPGIASQLQLTPHLHTEGDLKMITAALVQKVNHSRSLLGNDPIKYKPYKQVFGQAQKAYISAGLAFPFMEYKTSSVKKSMYGRMGNYLGFLGYYNPFTGEAQLNLTMPRFLIPYVSCHEMAHQLGYASESEASFVGYIASVQSDDILFHYSSYFDLYTYANQELYNRDSVAAKENYQQLDTLVKLDMRELKEYWKKSKNPVEPIIKIFYDNYLKANQQEKGLESYNEVVGWLIAYYKKYKTI